MTLPNVILQLLQCALNALDDDCGDGARLSLRLI
ncbi:hypothetical protein LMG27952_05078 [Paraburkholderia hiiakae]|uniref:Uncharacterized protein n=1 Tax=Paraburkholderia hiiakae TaxID=1081782 RepID=A0ABM8NZK9_9BURK|nr:hypothetical protein LMG27952_05078 [Paraburkholderia hiiakae]